MAARLWEGISLQNWARTGMVTPASLRFVIRAVLIKVARQADEKITEYRMAVD